MPCSPHALPSLFLETSNPASTMASSSVLNLLRVSRLPIHTQLVLEEALLRNTSGNWMLINDGAFKPAIVLGISGCVYLMVPQAQTAPGRPSQPHLACPMQEARGVDQYPCSY